MEALRAPCDSEAFVIVFVEPQMKVKMLTFRTVAQMRSVDSAAFARAFAFTAIAAILFGCSSKSDTQGIASQVQRHLANRQVHGPRTRYQVDALGIASQSTSILPADTA